MALAASMNDPAPSGSKAPPTSSQAPPPPEPNNYEEDEALARAIAASLNEEQVRPKPRRPNPNVSCGRSLYSSEAKNYCQLPFFILAAFVSAKAAR